MTFNSFARNLFFSILSVSFFVSKGPLVADIAILGDSISTGGAAHEGLKLVPKSFQELLSGADRLEPSAAFREALKNYDSRTFDSVSLEMPIRLPLSKREFRHPMLWYVESAWLGASSKYLDTEQYAWSYILARQLGASPKDILLAAKDGSKVAEAVKQIDRVMDYTESVLPEHTFMFFTGNDLCGLTIDFTTTAAAYESQLEDALDYLLGFQKNMASTVKNVWLIDPVGILQIVTSPSILEHKVDYMDKQISCKEMQTLKPSQSNVKI